MTLDISKIRKEYGIEQSVTDETITKEAERLRQLADKNLEMKVGNRLNWLEISDRYCTRRAIAEATDPRRVKEGFSDRYFGETSDLFAEGFYGPTLTSARAALERLLQEESMQFPALKTRIESDQRNPSIKDMVKVLGPAHGWDHAMQSAVETIETNGDWTVHHRLDQFSKGKKFGDYKLGIVTAKIDIGKGLQVTGHDLVGTVELNLGQEQRRRCIDSLTAMCQVFERYRT